MNKLLLSTLVVLAPVLMHTQPAAGQGGVIDWIHRLSGPSMLGPSLSHFWETETIRFRMTVSGRWAVGFKEGTIAKDHSVNMFAIQPTVEVPLCGPFEAGAGFAFNRLGGRGHDAVWKPTIPFYGQIRHPINMAGTWLIRVGVGGHLFPSFDESDFRGPEDSDPGVTVETDGVEVTFGMILGLDYTGGWRTR